SYWKGWRAGGAARDPGGAEGRTGESTGLRRRKAKSTSGLLGDRTREILRFAQNDNSKEGGQAPFGNGASPLGFGADFDVQELDLAVEVAALDLEVVRRLRDVPPVLAQLAPDVLPLERRPRVPQRRVVE